MSILIAGRRVLMIAIVTMGSVAPLLAGQGATKLDRGAIERGHATFREHCATCHGNHGKGDAPGAWYMHPRPANLTKLTKQYGAFPTERIQAILKGLDQTKAHGPGMMVWRAIFLADANGDEAAANQREKDVIAFLASLQPK